MRERLFVKIRKNDFRRRIIWEKDSLISKPSTIESGNDHEITFFFLLKCCCCERMELENKSGRNSERQMIVSGQSEKEIEKVQNKKIEKVETKKIKQIFPKDAFEMRAFDSRTKYTMKMNGTYNLWENSYTCMMWIRPRFFEPHMDSETRIMGLCSIGKWPEQAGPFVHFMFKGKTLIHSHFGQGTTDTFKDFRNEEWIHVAFVYNHSDRMQHIYLNGKSIHSGHKVRLLKAPRADKYTKDWFSNESNAYLGECNFVGHSSVHTKYRGEMFGAQMFVNAAFTAKDIEQHAIPFPDSKIHDLVFSSNGTLPVQKKAMSSILSQAAALRKSD